MNVDGEERQPRAGDVLKVTAQASVQFLKPIRFRVIRIHDWTTTFEGWIWLDGYQLDDAGNAVERRSIYVREQGLQFAGNASGGRTRIPRC
jgi:hypothetical protein